MSRRGIRGVLATLATLVVLLSFATTTYASPTNKHVALGDSYP